MSLEGPGPCIRGSGPAMEVPMTLRVGASRSFGFRTYLLNYGPEPDEVLAQAEGSAPFVSGSIGL